MDQKNMSNKRGIDDVQMSAFVDGKRRKKLYKPLFSKLSRENMSESSSSPNITLTENKAISTGDKNVFNIAFTEIEFIKNKEKATYSFKMLYNSEPNIIPNSNYQHLFYH